MKIASLLPLLLAVALPAAAADLYSWTDANGVKHFSDSPPPNGAAKAQRLKVKGGVTTAKAPQDDAQAKDAGPALAAAAGYSPDDIRRNCDIARKNLSTLSAQKPADADAARDHDAQVEKANQQIKLFCPKS